MTKRSTVAGSILVAWVFGMGLLVHREVFRPSDQRLTEAAMRVTPGAVYYSVLRDGQQVGFASSTLDTAQASITVVDYLLAEVPDGAPGGKIRRTLLNSNVTLTRALRVKSFSISTQGAGAPLHATGTVDGDSVLLLRMERNGVAQPLARIAISGPVLMPTLVPIALALGEAPKAGRQYALPVFDLATMTPRTAEVGVQAESSFVVHDSSAFDTTSKAWRGIQPDTLKAWRVDAGSVSALNGWIDEQGRVLRTSLLGFTLERLPYEVAYWNWRKDSTKDSTQVGDSDRDVLESTAIAANKSITRWLGSFSVRLSRGDFRGFDLDGGRQSLDGNVLKVATVQDSALTPTWTLGKVKRVKGVDSKYLRPEPLLQSNDNDVFLTAYAVQNFQHDPRVVAEALTHWVHDSVARRATYGVPNALEVLRTRAGDANEHTQLYVAMARSLGLPARVVQGVLYVDGKFYYHAWPEVFLGDWIGVDPTFGQFPADASHLRFAIGGLDRQASLLRLMSNLEIDVLDVNGKPPAKPGRQASSKAAAQ